MKETQINETYFKGVETDQNCGLYVRQFTFKSFYLAGVLPLSTVG